MSKNEEIAKSIIDIVGGKDNISYATHCITRLRLNLNNRDSADVEQLKNVEGVLTVVENGGQIQIVIGQNVGKVYSEFVAQTGLEAQASIEENLDDAPKEKLTPQKIGSNILNYLSGSLIQLIPVLIGAAMFKTVLVVVGPDLLGWVKPEDDLYILFDFIYNAGFYFLPIYLGYACANKLGVTPILGMFMGGVLIAPGFLAIVEAGTPFTIYGIPIMVNNYTQSVLPILLSVWIMSYVEKFFKKIMPDMLTTVFTPFLTVAVMVPVSFVALAPLGSFLGNDVISPALLGLGDVAGFLAVALIAAFWPYIVISGMHQVLIVTAITIIMEQGSEGIVLVGGGCAQWAVFGMALGAFIVTKDRQEKALDMGYFASGILGGITEPTLFGVGFKYKTPFIAMSIGGALGGLYAGLTGVKTYVFGATNFLAIIGYVGGGTENLVNGIIASVLSMVVAAVGTVFILRRKFNTLAVTV
jgi:PTS system beta-glucosides-specific IIC component